jgi:peroxiredoxin
MLLSLAYSYPFGRSFFCSFLLALFCALSWGGCTRSSSLEVGQKAPAFEAASLGEKRLRFPEDTAGKVVLIRFWAERCPHCEAEMKGLEETYQQHKEEGFVLLALNAGQTREVAAAFAQRLGLSYAVLLDEDNSIAKRYGVMGVPTSYMVDSDGVVRAKFVGQTPKEEFEKSATSLLKPTP